MLPPELVDPWILQPGNGGVFNDKLVITEVETSCFIENSYEFHTECIHTFW